MKEVNKKETGVKPKGRYVKKDGSETKKITFYLPISLIKKLKTECVDKDISMSALLQDVLEKHLK